MICFQVSPSNMAPLAIARSTSAAPCSYTRPQPSALWPTSLLPMSESLGRPTAVPWARRVVLAPGTQSESRVGVAASLTASDSPPSPTPTPSSTTRSSGPLGPANRGWRLSSSFTVDLPA